METQEQKFYYALGMRDAAAAILMLSKDKGTKLPWLAEEYLKNAGEQHVTHAFHTT